LYPDKYKFHVVRNDLVVGMNIEASKKSTLNESNRTTGNLRSKFIDKKSDFMRRMHVNLNQHRSNVSPKKHKLNEAFHESEVNDGKSKFYKKPLTEMESSNEAKELQERLLRESANRNRQKSMNKRKSECMNQTYSFIKPADVNILPKDHWKSSDLYYRLGLPRNASEVEIKKQFRKLALAYHPDKSTFVDGMTRFQAIKEAYELLCKP